MNVSVVTFLVETKIQVTINSYNKAKELEFGVVESPRLHLKAARGKGVNNEGNVRVYILL